MNSCFPFVRKKRKNNREVFLIILGLDNAGKTTTTHSIKGGKHNINLYDLGGRGTIRNIWHHYFAEVHGIIFVVDASDASRLEECHQVLVDLLSHDQVSGKPILLLANKSDTKSAIDEAEIIETLDLDELVNKYQCPCRLERCCALLRRPGYRGLDKPIRVGLCWLLSYIDSQWLVLQERANHDSRAQAFKQTVDLENSQQPLLPCSVDQRSTGHLAGDEQGSTDSELDGCSATANELALMTVIDLEDDTPTGGHSKNGRTETPTRTREDGNEGTERDPNTSEPAIASTVPNLLSFPTIQEQVALAYQVNGISEKADIHQEVRGKLASLEVEQSTEGDLVVRGRKSKVQQQQTADRISTRMPTVLLRKSAPSERKLQTRVADSKLQSLGRPPVSRQTVNRPQRSGRSKGQSHQRVSVYASGLTPDKTLGAVGLAPNIINPIYPCQSSQSTQSVQSLRQTPRAQRRFENPSSGPLMMTSPKKKGRRASSISRLLNPGINKLHPSPSAYTRRNGTEPRKVERGTGFNYSKHNFG